MWIRLFVGVFACCCDDCRSQPFDNQARTESNLIQGESEWIQGISRQDDQDLEAVCQPPRRLCLVRVVCLVYVVWFEARKKPDEPGKVRSRRPACMLLPQEDRSVRAALDKRWQWNAARQQHPQNQGDYGDDQRRSNCCDCIDNPIERPFS